jgi:hypothetical protein
MHLGVYNILRRKTGAWKPKPIKRSVCKLTDTSMPFALGINKDVALFLTVSSSVEFVGLRVS